MKTSKRESLLQQIATAAFFLGVFGTSAFAAPSLGVSRDQLKDLVQGLEVNQEGLEISFAGMMPADCAQGAQVSSDYRDNKHVINIRLPNCEKDFDLSKVPEDGWVPASRVLRTVKLQDQTGPVVLRKNNPDPGARRGYSEDALTDFEGKALAVESTADAQAKQAEADRIANEEEAKVVEAEKIKAAEEQAKIDLQNTLDEYTGLEGRIAQYCEGANFDLVGLTDELNKSAHLLGDVTNLIAKANDAYREQLERDLSEASTAEEALEAYEIYLEASDANSWDIDSEMQDRYIRKRFEILQASLEDSELSYTESEEQIRAWMNEVNGMQGVSREDRKTYKAKFAEMYAEVATTAANAGDVKETEKYFGRAKALSKTAGGKIAINGELAKVYAEKYKECVNNGPFKAEACEKKWLSKAKGSANEIRNLMKTRKGEDAASDMEAFEAEYAQTFGTGMSMNINGYGVRSQQPGLFEQYKQQAMQQAMMEAQANQQMQMQQMQMQQMGAAGMMNPMMSGRMISPMMGNGSATGASILGF